MTTPLEPRLARVALPTLFLMTLPASALEPEDRFSLDAPYAVAADRGGSRVVYVRGRWDAALDRVDKDLWIVDDAGERRLTFSPENEDQPVFSPDGAWIYHQAPGSPDASAQVWRLRADGSASQQLTRVDGGVGSWALTPEGDALVLVTHDGEARPTDPWDATRRRWGSARYGDAPVTRSTVHRLDLATFRREVVWTPEAFVMSVAVGRGGRLAALLAPDRPLIHHEGGSEVVVHPGGLDPARASRDADVRVPDARWRAEAPSPYGWLSGLAWSDDAGALAVNVDFDGFPGETYVLIPDASGYAGATVRALARPDGGHVEGAPLWLPDGGLCVPLAVRARQKLACHPSPLRRPDAPPRLVPEGDHVLSGATLSGDGKSIVAIDTTPTSFAEVVRLRASGGALEVLTALNPHTASWALPTLQEVTWTAPDGATVQGILELPPNWTPADGPLPLVVHLHGGPTAATPFARRFRAYGQTLYASRGWALLSPNYRGSTGFGDTFLTDLVGRENDIEVRDILAGVDHLIAEGIADGARMAVTGWSNGGYLTTAVIAADARFKAASAGAGVVDMTLQWSLEDTPGHVVNYLQGLPWEQPAHYQTASPLFQADRIKTPTLIHVGENDPRVPAAHARALHRALGFYLGIPVELVVYPGAGHGLTRRDHQLTKLSWDLAWFEHHVLGRPPPGQAEPAREETQDAPTPPSR